MFPQVRLGGTGGFKCGGVLPPQDYAAHDAGQNQFSVVMGYGRRVRFLQAKGDPGTFTIFCSLKRNRLCNSSYNTPKAAFDSQFIYGPDASNTDNSIYGLYFINDKLVFNNGALVFTSKDVFKDTTSWYNIVLSTYDFTTVRIWVNGKLLSGTTAIANNPAIQRVPRFNVSNIYANIGYNTGLSDHNFFALYAQIAMIGMIDGVAVDSPSLFGQLNADTREWVPKMPSGYTQWGGNSFLFSGQSDTTNDGADTYLFDLRANPPTHQIMAPMYGRPITFLMTTTDDQVNPGVVTYQHRDMGDAKYQVLQTNGALITNPTGYPSWGARTPSVYASPWLNPNGYTRALQSQATPETGMSYVEYVGTGHRMTVAHGLSKRPKAAIFCRQDGNAKPTYWYDLLNNDKWGAYAGNGGKTSGIAGRPAWANELTDETLFGLAEPVPGDNKGINEAGVKYSAYFFTDGADIEVLSGRAGTMKKTYRAMSTASCEITVGTYKGETWYATAHNNPYAATGNYCLTVYREIVVDGVKRIAQFCPQALCVDNIGASGVVMFQDAVSGRLFIAAGAVRVSLYEVNFTTSAINRIGYITSGVGGTGGRAITHHSDGTYNYITVLPEYWTNNNIVGASAKVYRLNAVTGVTTEVQAWDWGSTFWAKTQEFNGKIYLGTNGAANGSSYNSTGLLVWENGKWKPLFAKNPVFASNRETTSQCDLEVFDGKLYFAHGGSELTITVMETDETMTHHLVSTGAWHYGRQLLRSNDKLYLAGSTPADTSDADDRLKVFRVQFDGTSGKPTGLIQVSGYASPRPVYLNKNYKDGLIKMWVNGYGTGEGQPTALGVSHYGIFDPNTESFGPVYSTTKPTMFVMRLAPWDHATGNWLSASNSSAWANTAFGQNWRLDEGSPAAPGTDVQQDGKVFSIGSDHDLIIAFLGSRQLLEFHVDRVTGSVADTGSMHTDQDWMYLDSPWNNVPHHFGLPGSTWRSLLSKASNGAKASSVFIFPQVTGGEYAEVTVHQSVSPNWTTGAGNPVFIFDRGPLEYLVLRYMPSTKLALTLASKQNVEIYKPLLNGFSARNFKNNDVVSFSVNADNTATEIRVNDVPMVVLDEPINNVKLYLDGSVEYGFPYSSDTINRGTRPFLYRDDLDELRGCVANDVEKLDIIDPSRFHKEFSWTGNGLAKRFMDLGFYPDIFMWKRDEPGYPWVFRTRSMDKNVTCYFTSTAATTAVETVEFANGGIVLKNLTNDAGVKYIGIAFNTGPCNGIFQTTYVGDGTNGRGIPHGLNSKPVLYWIKPISAPGPTVVMGEAVSSTTISEQERTAVTIDTGAKVTSYAIPMSVADGVGIFVNGGSNVPLSINRAGVTYQIIAFAPVRGYSSFVKRGVTPPNMDGLGFTEVDLGFCPNVVIGKTLTADNAAWYCGQQSLQPTNALSRFSWLDQPNATTDMPANHTGYPTSRGLGSYPPSVFAHDTHTQFYMAFAATPFEVSMGK